MLLKTNYTKQFSSDISCARKVELHNSFSKLLGYCFLLYLHQMSRLKVLSQRFWKRTANQFETPSVSEVINSNDTRTVDILNKMKAYLRIGSISFCGGNPSLLLNIIPITMYLFSWFHGSTI